jgi:hypothetical protein
MPGLDPFINNVSVPGKISKATNWVTVMTFLFFFDVSIYLIVCWYRTVPGKIAKADFSVRRYGNYEDFITQLDKVEGGLEKFALGYKQFGPQVSSRAML